MQQAKTKRHHFPYLYVNHLSNDEKDQLRSQLILEYQNITTKFSDLVNNVCTSLVNRNVTPKELAITLMNVKPFLTSGPDLPCNEEIEKAAENSTIFSILQSYISFFNYYIIEYIVQKFGASENKENLDHYKRDLSVYYERIVFQCSSYSTENLAVELQLVVFVDPLINSDTLTITQVEMFRENVAEVLGIETAMLHLRTIEYLVSPHAWNNTFSFIGRKTLKGYI